MAWQLLVIDGADKDRFFPRPATGLVSIGSRRKNADGVLHDLYVARVHCELRFEDQRAVVTDLDTPGGTFINGQKIKEQEMRIGDVLRLGNSHMRLDIMSDEVTEGVDLHVLEEELDSVPVQQEKT